MTSAPTATEQEQLVAALEKSSNAYLAVITSVPESAAGARLSEECWSILQIAEHVAVAEHGMLRSIELAAQKDTPPDYSVDQKIIAGGLNREIKRQAPERAHPKGRWQTLAEATEAFKNARARTIEFARSAEGLRGKLVQHPLIGPVDGHQCLLIMAGHPQRHALQIEEIKASEAYLAASSR